MATTTARSLKPTVPSPGRRKQRGHVCVHDWRELKRDELRDEAAAYDGQAQGPSRLAASAEPESDRNGPEKRRHRRHHDGSETDETTLKNGVGRTLAFVSLGIESEIDLHDRILLDD